MRKERFLLICFLVILPITVISIIAFTVFLGNRGNEGTDVQQSTNHLDKFDNTTTGNVTEGREYRSLILENGMKVILVSDPNAQESGVSLSVAAGELNEDKDMPDTAHLLEHVLACFDSDILEFALDSKAETGLDSTLFAFAVRHSRLEELMNRISHCIIEPQFTDTAIQSEMSAVKSEHVTFTANEANRLHIVDRATAKKGHPYHTSFLYGSAELFGNDTKKVVDKLTDFHNKYYIGPRMGLVLLGNFTLDYLEKMAKTFAEKIPSGEKPLSSSFGSPYGKEELGVKILMNSEAGARTLILKFPVPAFMTQQFEQRAEYYKQLLTHPGQLYRHLMSTGLITTMKADCKKMYRGFSVFELSFELTELGEKSTDDVVCFTFEYIAKLRETGAHEWVWDEIAEADNTANKVTGVESTANMIKEAGATLTFVSSISNNLLEFSFEETILRAENNDEIQTEFSSHDLDEMLKIMVPENMRLYHLSQLYQDKENLTVEPFYGSLYTVDSISYHTKAKWEINNASSLFTFPKRNKYIPKDSTFRQIQSGVANDSKAFQLSTIANFEQDEELTVSKAFVRVEIFSPFANDTVVNSFMVMMISESLSELIELTSRAGIEVEIDHKHAVLVITVDGLSDGIERVVLEVMEEIATFDAREQLYNSTKEQYEQSLKSSMYSAPCENENYQVENVLEIEEISFEQKWADLEEIDNGMVAEYHEKFISRLNFRWTFTGNITNEVADRIVLSKKYFLESGTLEVNEVKTRPETRIQIQKGKSYIYKVTKHSALPFSSCVRVILQAPTTDFVLILLLNSMIDNSFFRQLRVKDHLGYGAHSSLNLIYGVLELFVEGEKNPAFVNTRINAFLEKFMDTLTKEEFQEHKTHLQQMSLIPGGMETLDKIKFEDFQKFYKEFTGLVPGKERRLTIHFSRGDYTGEAYVENPSSESAEEGDSYKNPISLANLTQWKQSMLKACPASNCN